MVFFLMSCFSEGSSKYKVSSPDDSSKDGRKSPSSKGSTSTVQPSSLLSPKHHKKRLRQPSTDSSNSNCRSLPRLPGGEEQSNSSSSGSCDHGRSTLPRTESDRCTSTPQTRHPFRSSTSSTNSMGSSSSHSSDRSMASDGNCSAMSLSSDASTGSRVSSTGSRASSTSSMSPRNSPEPERHYSTDTDEDFPTTVTSTTRTSSGSFSETNGLVGLRNIGNTCFLNSVTQCLSNTRCLLEYLVRESYNTDINTSSLSTMKGDLIRAFGSLIKEMWAEGDSNRALNTGPFKIQIQRFAPTFSGYQQHDAQEFLRKLLEGLHEDVNRVTIRPKPIHTDIDDDLSDDQKAMESWKRYLRYDDSKIVDMFVGQLKSSLQCSHCSHTSVTCDPFWDLSLPIPNKSGTVKLNQCLDLFTKEEVMDGDERPTCSKCKERRRMTKSFHIQKFPRVLVLHLKRFSPTERWRGKLSCTIEFPLESLDLSRYASSSRSSCTYNLIGVANHSGTTYSGHYTAFCRHPYSSEWHEYNDSRISSITPRRVCSPEAYVLFYELSGSCSKL